MSHFKPYPAYKDSGVEWLEIVPEHWSTVPFKWLAVIQNGKDYKDVQTNEEGFPVIGSGGEFARASQYLFNGESVLLGRKGTIDRPLFINGPFWTVDTMFYTVIGPKAVGKYLYYCALTIQFDRYSTNTALPSMTQEVLGQIPFAVPNVSEQQLIVAHLDRETTRIDTLVAKKTRFIELLWEKRQALITHAVTKGLDSNVKMKDSRVEWLGGMPNHWIKTPIKHVLNGLIDTEHKTVTFYDDGEYLVVRTTNIKNGELILDGAKYTNFDGFTEWTKRGVPKPGDILFTREAPAGEACLVPEKVKLCVGQRTVLMRTIHSRINPKFCLYSLYGGIAAEFIDVLSQGSTVAHFNMGDIGSIPILLPPLFEQDAIVSHLDNETARIDALINKTERSIEFLKERRSALIAAAVTGQIDLREAA